MVAVLLLDTFLRSSETLELTAREVQSSSLDGSPIMNYH